jgi:hypothetical protein
LPADLGGGGGERVVWNDESALRLLLKASGMDERVKLEHVNFGSGMDGMKLWNGATLVVRGFKNHSPHAHSPITKTPNFSIYKLLFKSCRIAPQCLRKTKSQQSTRRLFYIIVLFPSVHLQICPL